jgi:hypothetical protein
MRNWEHELERRADLAQELDRMERSWEREDRATAVAMRRVILDIERKRHARKIAALWFALGLSLAANALLWWVR